eukprot:4727959-Pyramimonas_sp.AAC.1
MKARWRNDHGGGRRREFGDADGEEEDWRKARMLQRFGNTPSRLKCPPHKYFQVFISVAGSMIRRMGEGDLGRMGSCHEKERGI